MFQIQPPARITQELRQLFDGPETRHHLATHGGLADKPRIFTPPHELLTGVLGKSLKLKPSLILAVFDAATDDLSLWLVSRSTAVNKPVQAQPRGITIREFCQTMRGLSPGLFRLAGWAENAVIHEIPWNVRNDIRHSFRYTHTWS